MAGLSKDDLAQMNRDYFQSLEKERLVEVADKLHQLAVEQWEKINYKREDLSPKAYSLQLQLKAFAKLVPLLIYSNH